MFLIEILLPLRDNQGRAFEDQILHELRQELTSRFGGVTAFNRAPAVGESREGKRTIRDQIIVLEIMVEQVDREWWTSYRKHLEKLFRQDEIVIRAIAIEKI
jgi:hypothetical protein